MAIVVFAFDRPPIVRRAMTAVAAVWLLLALGMVVNGVRVGYPLHVLVLDSLVT